ncbi:MAG: PEP-CTERM sorting domain-containing protein [Planctomycetes bacterium]|nr:PEP-CTERM sorting domain-containing protein [Planctomycetota bacterium]
MLSGSPSVYWAGTNNLSQTSPNAWTIGDGIAGSSNSGATWGSGPGVVQFRVDTAAAAIDISPPFVTAPAPFVARQGDVVTLAAIYGDSQDPNPSISWVTPFGNFTGNNIPMTIPFNAPLGTYPPAGIPITVTITDASQNSTSAQTSFTVTAAEAVPEPSTFVLAGLGLASLGLVAWRRRRARS